MMPKSEGSNSDPRLSEPGFVLVDEVPHASTIGACLWTKETPLAEMVEACLAEPEKIRWIYDERFNEEDRIVLIGGIVSACPDTKEGNERLAKFFNDAGMWNFLIEIGRNESPYMHPLMKQYFITQANLLQKGAAVRDEKLGPRDMEALKRRLSESIEPRSMITWMQDEHYAFKQGEVYGVSIDTIGATLDKKQLDALKSINHYPMPEHIKVEVLQEGGKTLVKVGPCDLSAVDEASRQFLIKRVVEEALAMDYDRQVADASLDWDAPVPVKPDFQRVSISASVAVEGITQSIKPQFFKKEDEPGEHMNAYIKAAGEDKLTKVEPRAGAQSVFDDNICAMVTCMVTTVFEYVSIHQSEDIRFTEQSEHFRDSILKILKPVFDNMLKGSRVLEDECRYLCREIRPMTIHKSDDFDMLEDLDKKPGNGSQV